MTAFYNFRYFCVICFSSHFISQSGQDLWDTHLKCCITADIAGERSAENGFILTHFTLLLVASARALLVSQRGPQCGVVLTALPNRLAVCWTHNLTSSASQVGVVTSRIGTASFILSMRLSSLYNTAQYF